MADPGAGEGTGGAAARPADARGWALEVGLAVAVALLAAYRDRLGVRLVPDGWALWEGSVSLLERGTYAYFAGDPIRYWPPLPALLLAGLQAVLGVSGATLIVFMAVISGAGWLGWTRLADALLPRDLPAGSRRALRVATGLLHAALVLGAAGTLLAHALILALLPWWLVAVLAAAGGERGPAAAAALAGLGAALLLTHHTAVVWWPGAALLLVVRTPGARARLAAVAPLVVAGLVALAVRVALDQGRSHPLRLGGRYGPEAYVVQTLTGLGAILSPTRNAMVTATVGMTFLGGWLAATRGGGRAAAAPRAAARLSLGALVGLFLVFNVVWVYDLLADRFVWVFPLVVIPALAARVAVRAPTAAVALVVAAAAAPTARAVVEAHVDWRAALGEGLVGPRAWISTRPRDPGGPREADRIAPWARPATHSTAEEDARRVDEAERR